MEKILKSILETEQEAENTLADAKLAAQKVSQEASVSAERLKIEQEKAIRGKVEAALSKVRQEASRAKEKILADAQIQAQALEKQAQAAMSRAVDVALNRLLSTT